MTKTSREIRIFWQEMR